jgi:SAM-dependent methyltransferase
MSPFLDQFSAPRLRDYWMRLALRGVHYANRPRKLGMAYLLEDPWRMQSAQEQARFGWTNRLIADRLAPHETILEIGCGEGHQSEHLAQLCERLYGIDLSARAVRRARRRCPAGRFTQGDPFTFAFGDMPAVIDLVVACEMVYYVRDIPSFIERISKLGKASLVTYYEGHAATLDPYCAARPGSERAQFRFDGVTWIAVWWGNTPAA